MAYPSEKSRRMVCLLMVQMLPEEALTEAIEALSNMLEFYADPPPVPVPEPPAPSVEARVTGTYPAPVFPIEEE